MCPVPRQEKNWTALKLEIDLMNEIKQKGVELGGMVAKLNIQDSVDDRWVSICATHLQQGLMALTRAVAKPDFF